jgi:hypothetical protein
LFADGFGNEGNFALELGSSSPTCPLDVSFDFLDDALPLIGLLIVLILLGNQNQRLVALSAHEPKHPHEEPRFSVKFTFPDIFFELCLCKHLIKRLNHNSNCHIQKHDSQHKIVGKP